MPIGAQCGGSCLSTLHTHIRDNSAQTPQPGPHQRLHSHLLKRLLHLNGLFPPTLAHLPSRPQVLSWLDTFSLSARLGRVLERNGDMRTMGTINHHITFVLDSSS